jgi:hypothetical protein
VGSARSVVLILIRVSFTEIDSFCINLSDVKIFGLIICFFGCCSEFLVFLVFWQTVVKPMMIGT